MSGAFCFLNYKKEIFTLNSLAKVLIVHDFSLFLKTTPKKIPIFYNRRIDKK